MITTKIKMCQMKRENEKQTNKQKNRRKIITMKKLFNHLTSYIKELKKVCLNKFSDNLKA